jgi:TonB family protein
MSPHTKSDSTWRAPELLLSFAGHVLVIGIAALASIGHATRDTRKPITFSVAVISPGTPVPQTESKGTTLVESRPKSHAKAQAKAEPRKGSNVVKRQGLGARIEGAEALGYSYYLNVILTRISDNWLNPFAGEARVLTATVMFLVERDGTVRDVKVEKKSGDPAYDASCERALLVLDRLPPLPPEFTGPRLKLHLEFEQKP